MSLVTLIIALLLLFVAIWAIQTLAVAFNIPPQLRTVILVLIVLLGVIWLVTNLGGVGPRLSLP